VLLISLLLTATDPHQHIVIMAAPVNNLPPTSRYITTHDPTTGKSVFSTEFPPDAPFSALPNGAVFTLDYTTTSTPVSFAGDSDLKSYGSHAAQTASLPPAFSTPGGTVIRHTLTPPGGVSPMHRTLTLDYMIVLDGEIELILDSGEKKTLKKGDTVIQRGTMHAWRNPSQTEWVRMLSILLPAEPLELNGTTLKEEYNPPPKV
jgi:quercetin dioxygenase-like cupin family protein